MLKTEQHKYKPSAQQEESLITTRDQYAFFLNVVNLTVFVQKRIRTTGRENKYYKEQIFYLGVLL